ncbi:unnamed protein product [Mesocestoides corti]|uniref:Uncharacterized protein n=1 Tax=Mesocestoides corti TaxID=53468 RepID=A0A0R3U9B4_MESCO|nr:unnamed protein product [Mesocestoides corti]
MLHRKNTVITLHEWLMRSSFENRGTILPAIFNLSGLLERGFAYHMPITNAGWECSHILGGSLPHPFCRHRRHLTHPSSTPTPPSWLECLSLSPSWQTGKSGESSTVRASRMNIWRC